MDKLMTQFIEEARELINNAGQSLLALEKSPDDATLIDTLFRDVHTLKGSAGVLELTPMVQVVHVLEELLELGKEGRVTLDAECIDVLLDTMDLLNSWIDGLDSEEKLPGDAESQSAKVVSQLEQLRASRFDGDEGASDPSPPAEESAVTGEGVAWGLFDDPVIPAEPEANSTPSAGDAGVIPDWLPRLAESVRVSAWEAAHSGDTVWAVRFEPEVGCFYRGDDPLLMARQTPGLLALDAQVPEDPGALDVLDVYQCQLVFGLLSRSEQDVLEDHFKYESDTVTIEPLMPEALIQPAGQSTGQPLDEAMLADLQTYWEQRQTDALANSIRVQLELLNSESREASLLRWLAVVVNTRPDDSVVFDAVLGTLTDPDAGPIDWTAWQSRLAPMATAPEEEAPVQHEPDNVPEPTPIRAPEAAASDWPELTPDHPEAGPILVDQLRMLEQCRESDLRAGAGSSAYAVLANVAQSLSCRLPDAITDAEGPDDLQSALKNWLSEGASKREASPASTRPAKSSVQSVPSDAPASSGTSEPSKADQEDSKAEKKAPDSAAPLIRNFKVDQEEVEHLGDLVGELVVAKNALPFLAQRAEQVYGERQLGREIREQFNVINRITRALQDAMMQVQMLPVSHVFGRFPRLVRDLSRKLDKPIDLTIEGDDTEAEKHVIESLADPLVHLMRNSIDHGIEPRDKRKAAHKPEVGKITLSARQENEWVVIEVSDDGGGIDPEKTRLKAYEKGLVDERKLHELSDKESQELIMMPGFSTLETASDLSGRGVGMDVVRNTIEKSGGRLELHSVVGQGTRFQLFLPLSMSISQVMQIWIDDQRYGIPMDQVAETVRLPAERIHRFKDRETVMLRDRVLPVVRSRDQLGLGRQDDGETVAFLVVRYRGELVAMVVDEFNEGVEVILKPMEGSLENLGVYQGTALLGDGSVLLVLNLGVLLSSVNLEEVVHEHSGEA